ncbi:DUF1810 domain-containing protein [Actinoplanes sp. NBRC 103695]|uniref:DUF1810 domain-containing protein n=1 Tax=Actinoplanes sp. NBRC 103695 TaxID=3032202 RepID=UPI0024A0C92C|nr:DUF1810 domain-containing protein [Actinoplanes sp. NBRC 103695]GLY95079.1 hypothetical protein Acsp02_23340 [Actinoplanes sp. NBRC 103695]
MPLLDLDRFVRAQENTFDRALAELRAGRKRSHWMWYVFPQLGGLGSSSTARAYAISGLAEASAYLAHPILGPRLALAASALLSAPPGLGASDILGFPDDLKLRSSMTLFAAAAEDPALFEQVLERFYDGPDERTLALLSAERRS